MERMDRITGELKAKDILIQRAEVQVRGTDDNGDVYMAGMGRLDRVTGELNTKDIIRQTAKVQVRGTEEPTEQLFQGPLPQFYDDNDDVYMADNETYKLREKRTRKAM